MNSTTTISSIAHFVPPNVITNEYFSNVPDEDYVFRKTGIIERRYMNGPTSEMIIPAIISCIEKRGIWIAEIDCIIVATITPDYQYPSTAAVVINKLGLENCWGFDISAACSGFVYGLQIAANMVTSNSAKKVLVCGADKMSSSVSRDDYKSAMILADGAGVALVEKCDESKYGIVDVLCRVDAAGLKDVYVPNGGTENPLTPASVIGKDDKILMLGRKVYIAGVKAMADAAKAILNKAGQTINNIDFLVPHQSNALMIREVADQLGIPMEKVLMNVSYFGNTSAATIPICLSEFSENGKIKKGDKLLLSSVGSGYAIGAAILIWNI